MIAHLPPHVHSPLAEYSKPGQVVWHDSGMGEAEVGGIGAPQPGTGGNRGAAELLLAMLTGSALAPFLQAVATKTGDDVHAKIRDLLGRRRRHKGTEPSRDRPVRLADPATAVVLQLPPRLSTSEAAALAVLRLPANWSGGWLLVEHDPKSSLWTATMISNPPPDAIEVGSTADNPRAQR